MGIKFVGASRLPSNAFDRAVAAGGRSGVPKTTAPLATTPKSQTCTGGASLSHGGAWVRS